jgi:predicted Zn-dependent peptidase
MSADEVNKSFYKLACDFGVSSGEKQSYVYLSGIQSNFEQALALFEKLLAEAEPNNEQLTTMVERIVKGRQDSKLNKRAILWGPLRNYAVYGKDNPSNDILSETQLKALTGKELTTYIHNLTAYPHKVYYYGPLTNPELVTTLTKYHKPRTMMAAPTEKKYVKQQSAKPIIYFVDYDMVQAEIIWHYNSNQLNVKEAPMVAMFNEYFGGGMSSIVFQTIRESKALAYSTYSVYSTGVEKGETNTVLAYIGTQADKINEAIKGMDELLQELPQSENAFSNAKEAVKNNIETQRTLKTSILFALDNAEKMSIDYDIRKDTYKAIDGITLQDLNDFHKQKFSGKPYAMAILGSKSKIDLKELEKYGEVKILTLEEIFGY